MLRSRESTTKSLVFSQFVNFLDLIAYRLQKAGFVVCDVMPCEQWVVGGLLNVLCCAA